MDVIYEYETSIYVGILNYAKVRHILVDEQRKGAHFIFIEGPGWLTREFRIAMALDETVRPLCQRMLALERALQ